MELLQSLWAVVTAVAQLVVELIQFATPWIPLLAWIAFWLCAVNWRKLYPIIFEQGGWTGVVLTWFMAILVWSVIWIPEGGTHNLYGLQVQNMTGKMVYVTSLFVIAFLCGTVQMSGTCGSLCKFDEPETVTPDVGHTHH